MILFRCGHRVRGWQSRPSALKLGMTLGIRFGEEDGGQRSEDNLPASLAGMAGGFPGSAVFSFSFEHKSF